MAAKLFLYLSPQVHVVATGADAGADTRHDLVGFLYSAYFVGCSQSSVDNPALPALFADVQESAETLVWICRAKYDRVTICRANGKRHTQHSCYQPVANKRAVGAENPIPDVLLGDSQDLAAISRDHVYSAFSRNPQKREESSHVFACLSGCFFPFQGHVAGHGCRKTMEWQV